MRISDQIAEQLYQLVQQRQLQPGQRLPAERQLAEENEGFTHRAA